MGFSHVTMVFHQKGGWVEMTSVVLGWLRITNQPGFRWWFHGDLKPWNEVVNPMTQIFHWGWLSTAYFWSVIGVWQGGLFLARLVYNHSANWADGLLVDGEAHFVGNVSKIEEPQSSLSDIYMDNIHMRIPGDILGYISPSFCHFSPTRPSGIFFGYFPMRQIRMWWEMAPPNRSSTAYFPHNSGHHWGHRVFG